MKKVAALVALSLLMAGCVSNDKIAVTPEQLQHHRFVLESVNGKPVTNDKNPPEISFGEKMMISGSMCAALLLSACSSEPVQQATAAHVAPGLKASMSSSGEANCAMIGGSLSVARQLDGTAIGMCALPNGKRCSEQSLAAGSCGSY